MEKERKEEEEEEEENEGQLNVVEGTKKEEKRFNQFSTQSRGFSLSSCHEELGGKKTLLAGRIEGGEEGE